MPTVPVYDEQHVATKALPTLYAQPLGPGAFGAGLGEGLQSAGAQLEAYGKKERQKQDLARVQDGQAVLGQWRADNLYDENKGYLHKKGKDALGQQDKYLADYDSTVEAISANLGNDDQRRAFRAEAAAQREHISTQMASHALQQADVLADGSYKAVLSTATSDAANGYTDPAAVAEARHQGMFAVLARSKAEGWAPEETDAQLRTFTTAMHLSVVDRMMAAGDGLGAQKYLAANGKEIDGAERAKADRLAEAAGVDQRGLAEARRIQAEASDPTKQLELAKAIPDARLQDATTERLQHDAAAAERARDLVDAQRLGRTVQAIESGTPGWKLKPDFLEMADDKKALAMERDMAVRRQRRALNQEDRRAAAEARREQHVANETAVQQLLSLPLDQQASVDLKTSFPGVDQLGLAQLGNHQRRAKQDVEKGLVPDRTQFDDRVKEALTGAGLEGPDAKAAVAYMHSWREQFYRDHGGKGPTRDDLEGALGKRLTQVKVEGSGFLFDDSTSLLEAEQNAKYAGKKLVPQWSEEQLATAKAAFAARGKGYDDATLDRWLRAKYGLPQGAPPDQQAPASVPAANTAGPPSSTATAGE